MGGEKPVSLIGSPMCQAFCDLIMMMRDANGVSEVKCKNLVERCAEHPEEKEMYQVLRHAGRLFLHEQLWDRWSRGLSFVKEVSEGPDVRETESESFRSQLTLCLIIEELSMCCCNEDGQTKNHVKNFVMIVSRGLKRVIVSVEAFGSKEIGGVSEESNVAKSDEYTK